MKREAFAQCIADVAAKAAINEDEAWGIIQTVANRGEQLRKQNVGGAFVQAAADLATQTRQAAAQKKADAFRNAMKVEGAMVRIRSEGGIATAAKTIRSMLHWLPGAKDNQSAETLARTISRNFIAVLGNQLREKGLEQAAISNNRELEYQIAGHIWKANETGSPVTAAENDPASQIAAALKPVLDAAKERLNAVGAHIGTAIDYVSHTNWNPRQLRKAAGAGATTDQAFEAWLAADGPRIADKTFDHLTPEDGETMEQAKFRFLRSLFDATSSGVHQSGPADGLADDGTGYIPPAYEGPRNTARGNSEKRVVYWKDAKSWVDHQQQFGGGVSLYAQTQLSINRAAHDIALMEKFGTIPAANLNRIIRSVQEEYRTDHENLAAFNSAAEELRTVMGRLDGSLNTPVNEARANLVNSLLSWEAMSDLGAVQVAHITAAPMTVSSELTHHGIPRRRAIGNVVTGLLEGRSNAEKQRILASAGAYARGHMAPIFEQINLQNGVPGTIANITARFFRMTGLEAALGRLQANAVRGVLMENLGSRAAAPFAEIDPHEQAVLRRYGINEPEWDLLRTADGPHVEGDLRYMTPSDALNTDNAKITGMLKAQNLIGENSTAEDAARAVKKFQWDLGDKLGMYLNDAADHATVTPGVKESSGQILGLGQARPGSGEWMLRRAFLQFKMWPIAAFNQIITRDVMNSLTSREAVFNVGAVLALTMLGGRLRMAIKDAMYGNPQRDNADSETWLAALAQGGGLGIYGDFLFGELNRFGTSLRSRAVGPLASDAEALFKIYSRFVDALSHPQDFDKRAKDIWPEIARWGVAHVPFANLIYLKGALDYMLFYHIYETASPGWWERTNRRLEKDAGRTMTGYVPGGGVPYGVPGVYLSGNGR